MGEKRRIDTDLDVNINYLKDLLGVGESFDVIFREYKIGRKRAASFSINGMTNDILLADVIEDMTAYNQEELSVDTLQKVFYHRATHSQVKLTDEMNDALTSMLSGELIFFIDGASQAIVFDARAYPARTPTESSIEKITRGSRDSFVETLPFNTALIRRRLRDPNLRFEIVKVGTRSQSDICVCYIKDVTNPRLVEIVKRRLNNINIDGIPMAEKAIEEFIVGGRGWNPLPKVRYTERPDVAAVHLLEGHVCIITDTSPNVMILPTTFWHHLQHAEEYHQNAIVGTYLRTVRLWGILLAVLLPPLWLAAVLQRHLLPETLVFLGPRDAGVVPIGVQFILAELGFELVRMATVHVPSAQSTALGFIGAFMLGEFATKIGLFGNETILYTAVAAVGNFATPSVEFAMAVRLFRFFLLLLVMFFKLPGLLAGILVLFLLLLFTRSFGVPYFWPLLPPDLRVLKGLLLRIPMPDKIMRPAVLKPQDPDRLAPMRQKEQDRQDSDAVPDEDEKK